MTYNHEYEHRLLTYFIDEYKGEFIGGIRIGEFGPVEVTDFFRSFKEAEMYIFDRIIQLCVRMPN